MSLHGSKTFTLTWSGITGHVTLAVNEHDTFGWREAVLSVAPDGLYIYVDYLKLWKNAATPQITQPDRWVLMAALYAGGGYSTDWAQTCSGSVDWKAEARWRFSTSSSGLNPSPWQDKFSNIYHTNC